MDVPGSGGSLAIEVGTNHGAIVVGDHNVVHLQVAAPQQLTARAPAAVHRPHAPDGFLDRHAETATLLAALDTHRLVDVGGPARIGKSWFALQAAEQAAARFADGALHLPPGLQGPRDVLQSLFEMFYDAEPPMAPSPTRLRELLADRRALVVVDDSPLGAKDAAAVLDAARGCRLLVVAEQPPGSDDALAITLGGLPIDDAMALAERTRGRTLDGAERAALLERCRAVGGHPQRVIDAVRALAAPARSEGLPPPQGDAELAVLETVRAFAPRAVPREALAELAGVPEADRALAALIERDWLVADAGEVRLAASADAPADAARRRVDALVRLGRAARARPALRRAALKALPLLWMALAGSASARSHVDVLALAQAWHVPVTLGGLWDGWRTLLDAALGAARANGDTGAQAWALHQGGTRELALGQTDAATTLFEQALQIELTLGDTTLQAATQYHLDLIAALPPPGPPANDGGGAAPVAWGWKAGLGAAVLGAAGTAWVVSAPELGWEPRELDFGVVVAGASAPVGEVVFRNRGARAVRVATHEVGGSGAAGFAVDTSCAGRALARAETCVATVRFVATTGGAHEATLTLLSTDNRTAATVALRGRVQQAELQLPERLDFGTVDVGGEAAERRVELRNAGAGTVRITGFTAPAAPFALLADACRGRALAPGQACAATLRFAAVADGPAEQALRLTLAEGQGLAVPPVQLSGSGRAGALGALGAEPAQVDFGNQEVGQRVPPQVVQVVNRGSAPLALARPLLSPPGAPFRVEAGGCRGATLAPGDGCEMQLTFVPRPGQRGERTATVSIDAGPGAPLALPVRGTGVAAEAVLQPPVLDFGNRDWPVAPGAPPRKTVSLSNRGDAPLRLAALRGGGPNLADFPYTARCPPQLEPGERCDITVRYTPHAAGASDAYLVLDTPDGVNLRLPLLARAVRSTPAVAELRLPRDQANIVCPSSETQVDFEWNAPAELPAGPVTYRLVLEQGNAVEAGPLTRLRTTVKCPAIVRWRVETTSPNQASGATPWRTLRTYRSGAGAGPPGTRASG